MTQPQTLIKILRNQETVSETALRKEGVINPSSAVTRARIKHQVYIKSTSKRIGNPHNSFGHSKKTERYYYIDRDEEPEWKRKS